MSDVETTRTIYSSEDFAAWMERAAQSLFGLTRASFMLAYRSGRFNGNLTAKCLASVENLAESPG